MGFPRAKGRQLGKVLFWTDICRLATDPLAYRANATRNFMRVDVFAA